MAGALSKYEWLASLAIDFGFPVIGAALGVPSLAPAAAAMLKKALGMSDSASLDSVRNTIEADPEGSKEALAAANSEASAKWEYLARAAEARAEVDKANISAVNKTMQAELGKVSWWHWRHLLGYVVGFHILAFPMATFAVVIFSSPEKTNAILNFPLVGVLGIGAGLLGFVANDNTKKGVAAMTGEAPEGVVASTIRAVTGRKK